MMSSPPSGVRPQFSFSWPTVKRLGRLVRKEFVEILRDRRTILTLFAMPLLLYPLLTVTFRQFILASGAVQEYRFGFATKDELAFFEEFLDRELKEQRGADKWSDKKQQPFDMIKAKTPVAAPKIRGGVSANLAEKIRSGEFDVGLHFPGIAKLQGDRDALIEAEASLLPGSTVALAALDYLQRLLAARNVRLLEKRLDVPGAEPKIKVVKLKVTVLQVDGAGSPISLGALVPLILILMTITGAVYPAIDLTAGERERGTLEILVAAPVPRLGLLFAKYVSVLSVAVMTALVNLVTMFVTLQLSGMGSLLFGKAGWPLLLVVQMFGLLLLFGMFFSAVLLCLTSFARSFKEAQAYLIPLMLASLGPGLMGMIPGLKLEGALTVAPLINIVLLARDLFESGADPLSAFLVVVSTLLYALAALSLAASIFGAEGVLYSEQTGWSDLLRRPRKPSDQASVGAALGCLALMIPGSLLLQAMVQELNLPAPMLFASVALGSIILFGLFPVVGAYMQRVRPGTGFALGRPSVAALVGGLFLGLSAWPFVLWVMLRFPVSMPSINPEQVEKMLESLRRYSGTQAIAMGIVGVVEELFFRGYLFSAVAKTTKPLMVIALTAFLFGVMHALLSTGFGLGQILPAMLMGVVLGTVRWQTGSVVPGMLLHLCHNVFLALIGPKTSEWHDQVPIVWLSAGLVGCIVGGGLVYYGRRKAVPV